MAEMQDLEVEASELEVVEQQDTDKEHAAKVETPEDIPDEFKGMSVAELARVAKHARTQMGKQANELGEIRKLADELIKSQLQKKPEPEPVKEVDFFENPQEAIRRAVETNPKVVAAETQAEMYRKVMAKAAFDGKRPDSGEIIADPQFGEWISKSKVRLDLWQKAVNYDVESADELFSTFKELKAAKAERSQVQVSDAEKTARTKTLQTAAVDTGGSGESGKKVYRRADLIRLKMRDPAKYEDMADEILKAYSEGRVK